jgi:hypothetical protein
MCSTCIKHERVSLPNMEIWNVRIYSSQMRKWINLHNWQTWNAGQAVCSFAGQHLDIINVYGEIKCFQVTLMFSTIQPNTTMPYTLSTIQPNTTMPYTLSTIQPNTTMSYMFPSNTLYNLQKFFSSAMQPSYCAHITCFIKENYAETTH